jgi:hypothetical protein
MMLLRLNGSKELHVVLSAYFGLATLKAEAEFERNLGD